MYELIKGSIFDKKCDMLVIPCNTFGGVTSGILSDMNENKIQYNSRNMNIGDVNFHFSINQGRNAWVIAFAAAVDASSSNKSKTSYIHRICEQIKTFCHENEIRLVNIPLLGTGAGGLEYKESFLVLKECFEREREVMLRIFAYSDHVYDMLVNDNVVESNEYSIVKSPRVFISYAGDDLKNRNWVKNFACKLRENGVDARLDIFHLKAGEDLPQWMTNEIFMADKVLLICDKYYAKKADMKRGGVGWETMIIHGDMMSNIQTNKYICIVRTESIDIGMPIYTKSRYSLHWSDEDISETEFKSLMYNIFDCDIAPEIGEIPTYIKKRKNN